eukprot:Blabericola_migrator_1__4155@NODE_226_length_11123_cov_75_892547_g192_i0_p2_GENE_NODE_226_length_11123_cov_75_892547_g192_i0NODE_226_length_11123_cov_75_892547_g192_i0_p2_ORF_typecomplete_len556_score108_01IMS_C/PF11799_8/1_7e05IMS/PF00817_20/0_12Hist_rich_Cabd/PF10529_9/3_6_NODE_226_length_11123_cov_75_892547_g192_i05792246
MTTSPVTFPPMSDQWRLGARCQLLTDSERHGCYLAREIQLYLLKKMTVTCSIGISNSRIVSRLIVPMNKPAKLTLYPCYETIDLFLKSTPITKVHGFRGINGAAIEAKLRSALPPDPGLEPKPFTLFDLQQFTEPQLCGLFGDKCGLFLSKIRYGKDYNKIQDRGPPQSILVELSFDPMTKTVEIYQMMRNLAQDLLHRVCDNAKRFNRRQPTKFTVRWRRGPELSIGSQVFAAPRSIATMCHEAIDSPDTPPSALKSFPAALENLLGQALRIVTKALDQYPDTQITKDRKLNRIGFVANAFISAPTPLKLVPKVDTEQLERSLDVEIVTPLADIQVLDPITVKDDTTLSSSEPCVVISVDTPLSTQDATAAHESKAAPHEIIALDETPRAHPEVSLEPRVEEPEKDVLVADSSGTEGLGDASETAMSAPKNNDAQAPARTQTSSLDGGLKENTEAPTHRSDEDEDVVCWGSGLLQVEANVKKGSCIPPPPIPSSHTELRKQEDAPPQKVKPSMSNKRPGSTLKQSVLSLKRVKVTSPKDKPKGQTTLSDFWKSK